MIEFDVFHPSRPGIRKILGELEAEIMEYVWLTYRGGEAIAVRDVYEELHRRRNLAYTTVMSTMARLARKGMLEVDTGKQAYTYRPRVSQDELVKSIVAHVVGSLMLNFEGETRSFIRDVGAEDTDSATARENLGGQIRERKWRSQP